MKIDPWIVLVILAMLYLLLMFGARLLNAWRCIVKNPTVCRSDKPDLTDQSALRSMDTAPKDGTYIWLLIRHKNYDYAGPSEREHWQGFFVGSWLDSNGGGWAWDGMSGTPIAWHPLTVHV